MNSVSIIFALASVVSISFGILVYLHFSGQRQKLVEKERQIERRMYELAILKELGDRIGYSLNVQNIVDIITGSLHQFIEYSAVSYMLLEPEKLIFKVHLEKSVSRTFINDIKVRMQKSLSALLNEDTQRMSVEEILSGAILVDDVSDPVRSFFNIPLVIGDKVVGVLTVAHTSAGLYQEEETTILYKITQQASQAVTRLQEVIAIEQRKLNAMVASMIEGVVMTDRDYRVVVVNPAARKLIGLDGSTEVTIFDLIEKLSGALDIRGKLEESVKLDKVLTVDEVVINRRSFQVFVSPVKGAVGLANDEVLGGVVIFHDITHDKELEKLREDFTSMMVHELRSPLDGIKMMTQYIAKEKSAKAAKQLKQYNQLINENTVNMLNLVNDLLDVAKLEAGRFQINPESIELLPIISDKVEFYKPLAKERGISLAVTTTKEFVAKVPADGIRVGQVMGNLISNALKFTPQGGKVVINGFLHHPGQSWAAESDVESSAWFVKDGDQQLRSLPESLVVTVTDSGEGVPAQMVPQLFSKFIQLESHSTDADRKGTGLGLVIAKGIIEAHNGVIGVSAQEGRGSTFYFTLPVPSIIND